MLSMFTQGYRYVRKSTLSTRGVLLAQQRMEELRHDFATVTAEAKHALTNMPFFRTVAVTPLYGVNLKQITVTISWAGEQGERSVSLTTLLANF